MLPPSSHHKVSRCKCCLDPLQDNAKVVKQLAVTAAVLDASKALTAVAEMLVVCKYKRGEGGMLLAAAVYSDMVTHELTAQRVRQQQRVTEHFCSRRQASCIRRPKTGRARVIASQDCSTLRLMHACTLNRKEEHVTRNREVCDTKQSTRSPSHATSQTVWSQ